MIDDFKKDCHHAAEVITTFRSKENFGIPASIIKSAKGIAVLHVTKIAVFGSTRSGHGVVVAKRPDGSWSAPSAIETSGKGFGEEFGIEISDLVFVLNTDAAVESFKKGHNFTVAGDVSFALGPVGRDAQVALTARHIAPIYTYAHSKGLFAGASIELSMVNQRLVTNAAVYGIGTKGEDILNGNVAVPNYPEVQELYTSLGNAAQEE
ncbi:UNVERIFIED_CONTAM: hypothetical protein HDU68_003430 [Siphonaria sp. JEL0065]|nr:hypothetical protein HDU68_003430 [Siphonaria sp. JEL0065]